MSSDAVGAAYDRILVLHRRGTLTALEVLGEVLALLDAGVAYGDVADFWTSAEGLLPEADRLELEAHIAARIGARALRLRRRAERLLSTALIAEVLAWRRPGDAQVRDTLAHAPAWVREWWREEAGEE